MTEFTLVVALSEDGFIGASHDAPPHTWASSEEQVLFFADVEAADWSILGRVTHEAADRPDRRRIVFSTSKSGWQQPSQLWIDPNTITPRDLPKLVEHVHPMKNALILGGTRVHDWFLAHDSIDHVRLTIEPVRFGKGLPMFSGQEPADALSLFESRGFVSVKETILNAQGTRHILLERGPKTDAAAQTHSR